jgi:hypothetical protein
MLSQSIKLPTIRIARPLSLHTENLKIKIRFISNLAMATGIKDAI